jgi:hypothetical protein
MKTSQVIDLYCEATSNLMNIFNLWGLLTGQQEEDASGQLLFSAAGTLVRTFYDLLPESLQTLNPDEYGLTYLHNHKLGANIDYGSYETACRVFHDHAYRTYEAMNEARETYGFVDDLSVE